MAVLPFAATLPLRAPLVAEDLSALGVAMPAPLAFRAPAETGARSHARRPCDPGLPPSHGEEAAAWGTLYVVEGSRLGGAMLARRVPAGWPAAYLGAVHAPGGWRAIRAAIDAAGAKRDREWREAMVAGARETFALYARAAG